MRKGCQVSLVMARDVESQGPSLEDVLVVRKFSDVFPNELLGLPLEKDIEFCTNIVPNTQPILVLHTTWHLQN